MAGNLPLRVRVDHRLGSLHLDVDLALGAPWTVLFGHSGSGKSTLLRMIAGLMRPHTGSVELLGRTLVDTRRGIWVPPHRRPIRWAGQREVLFPHMTVVENLLCGADAGDDAERALDVFGLRALAHRHPGQLSGGQRQRVSVARSAIGARDKLLLLDEPFTGLDAVVRHDTIAALRDWLGDTPVVSVTHDVGEAFLLGADIIRMAEGHVIDRGPVEKVLAADRARLQALLEF